MLPIIPIGGPMPVMMVGQGYNREKGRREGYEAAMRDMQRARAVREMEGGSQSKKTTDHKGRFTKYLDHKQKHEEYHDFFKGGQSSRKPADDKGDFTKYLNHKNKHEEYHKRFNDGKSSRKTNDDQGAFTKYLGYKEKHEKYRGYLEGGNGGYEWDQKTQYPAFNQNEYNKPKEDSYAKYKQYQDAGNHEKWRGYQEPQMAYRRGEWDNSQGKSDSYSSYQRYKEGSRSRRPEKEDRRSAGQDEMGFGNGR